MVLNTRIYVKFVQCFCSVPHGTSFEPPVRRSHATKTQHQTTSVANNRPSFKDAVDESILTTEALCCGRARTEV